MIIVHALVQFAAILFVLFEIGVSWRAFLRADYSFGVVNAVVLLCVTYLVFGF